MLKRNNREGQRTTGEGKTMGPPLKGPLSRNNIPPLEKKRCFFLAKFTDFQFYSLLSDDGGSDQDMCLLLKWICVG